MKLKDFDLCPSLLAHYATRTELQIWREIQKPSSNFAASDTDEAAGGPDGDNQEGQL